MNIEEKYEPQYLADLVFADKVAQAVCKRYATSSPYKPLMLWGPPGTAKTSTARVIVRERYRLAGFYGAIEEFNGDELASKDFDKLLNVASWLRFNMGEAILIINEFDGIDKADQAKFRAWMDKWKWINLVVTTNAQPGVAGVHQKFIPALLSRFERVELASPSLEDWLPRAEQIFLQEGHTVSQSDLSSLLSSFSGDVRDMLPVIEATLADLQQTKPGTQRRKPVLHVVPSDPSKSD